MLVYKPVDTRSLAAVEAEVEAIYQELFADATPEFVSRAFRWAADSFAGACQGYQAIDADYHDFEHTLSGALCLGRLLQGRWRAGAAPTLSRRVFELGILAILLHDTGYLKQAGDNEGTGAKYTAIHVDRSGDFAQELLGRKGYSATDIQAVRNMIHCTGVNVSLADIGFQSEAERVAGYALGTADLLGQVAAPNYVEKLPELFEEFSEAATFTEGKSGFVGAFKSAEDLMRRTPQFWSQYVLPKIERDFQGLYRFLNRPYPDGQNWYMDRAKANIERLRRMYPGD